jgi:2-phosphoglycerate kinase
MLYLIGGASRSGKTIIAKTIAAQKSIPYLSLDWLVMGFTNGIPEYGIHDLLMPDEIAEQIWDFLKAMCESMLWSNDHCIIEGEAILPELIIELKNKYPDQIKIGFLGFTNIKAKEKVKNVKEFSEGETDWLIDKPDTYISDHIKNMIRYSKKIKASCEKNDIRYFDTSKNFKETLKSCAKYLNR